MEENSKVIERTHDLVVLSVGMQPAFNPETVYGVSVANDGFVTIPNPTTAPCVTDRTGIFVTGTAGGPMDIVDSIVMAGAAASEAVAHIENKEVKDKQVREFTH
jgi:heterodisulfide reductase subunit A